VTLFKQGIYVLKFRVLSGRNSRNSTKKV